MIAKVNLEEFRNKIKEFRQKNNFKLDNAMTDRDKEYYSGCAIGFEKAITMFLMCAKYELGDEDEVQK